MSIVGTFSNSKYKFVLTVLIPPSKLKITSAFPEKEDRGVLHVIELAVLAFISDSSEPPNPHITARVGLILVKIVTSVLSPTAPLDGLRPLN